MGGGGAQLNKAAPSSQRLWSWPDWRRMADLGIEAGPFSPSEGALSRWSEASQNGTDRDMDLTTLPTAPSLQGALSASSSPLPAFRLLPWQAPSHRFEKEGELWLMFNQLSGFIDKGVVVTRVPG